MNLVHKKKVRQITSRDIEALGATRHDSSAMTRGSRSPFSLCPYEIGTIIYNNETESLHKLCQIIRPMVGNWFGSCLVNHPIES